MADAINRTAVTGADGSSRSLRFLRPLPGVARRTAYGRLGTQNGRPLRAAFTARKVSLKAGETPETLEIGAAPHVMIEAQCANSKGRPSSASSGHVLGQVDAVVVW